MPIDMFPELTDKRISELTIDFYNRLIEFKYAMKDKEWNFIKSIGQQITTKHIFIPTNKQFIWLKDLKEKYCD